MNPHQFFRALVQTAVGTAVVFLLIAILVAAAVLASWAYGTEIVIPGKATIEISAGYVAIAYVGVVWVILVISYYSSGRKWDGSSKF